MKRVLICLIILPFVYFNNAQAAVVTFDDFGLGIPPSQNYSGKGGGRYYNGSDGAGEFSSGGAKFKNNFNSQFGSWSGWSNSNTTDLTTAGLTNQYSAFNSPNGGGRSGNNDDQYGIYFEPFGALAPTIEFDGPVPVNLGKAWITNTTYAYKAIVEGNDGNSPPFIKGPFGAGDFFKLTVTGFDKAGNETNSLDIFLADYTSSDSDDWFALDKWTEFDLSSLGAVSGLGFDLSSTDNDPMFGFMNTPAYFALDDLNYNPVPVPAAVWLLGTGLVGLLGLRRRMTAK